MRSLYIFILLLGAAHLHAQEIDHIKGKIWATNQVYIDSVLYEGAPSYWLYTHSGMWLGATDLDELKSYVQNEQMASVAHLLSDAAECKLGKHVITGSDGREFQVIYLDDDDLVLRTLGTIPKHLTLSEKDYVYPIEYRLVATSWD